MPLNKYLSGSFGDSEPAKIKARIFHGITRAVDPNDISIQPEVWTDKGVNFWIENGNLTVRNNFENVLTYPVLTGPSDVRAYGIASMHEIPPWSYMLRQGSVGVGGGGFLLVGANGNGHNALLTTSTMSPGYWSELTMNDGSGQVPYYFNNAKFSFVNYEVGGQPRTIATNGYDPPVYTDGATVSFLKSDGWVQATINASTDVVTFAAGPAITNGTEVELFSIKADMPGGINRFKKYYARDVSGSTCKLASTLIGAAIDLTSTGTSVMIRTYNNVASDAPWGTSVMLHSERVWIGGCRQAPDTIYHSDSYHDGAAHADVWTAANVTGNIPLPTWDGDVVAGIRNINGSPYVTKGNSVFTIDGNTPPYSVRQLYTAKGTVSPDSLALWDGFLFQATTDGIYMFNGASSEPFLTDEIKGIWSPNNWSCFCNVLRNTLFVKGEMTNPVTSITGTMMLAVDLKTKDVCLWDMTTNDLQATNLVSNGNFGSMTGWATTTANASAAGYELIMTATAAAGRVSQTNIPLVVGHKYYLAALVKASSSSVKMALYDGSDFIISVPSSGSGTYEYLSGVGTATNTIGIAHALRDERSSGWTEARAQYVKLIDLTEMFGAGYEPTKAQLDVAMLEWVNGTEIVDTGSVFGAIGATCTLDPWYTTKILNLGDGNPALWFGWGGMIYRYSNTPPTSNAPAMVYYDPQNDYGVASKRKQISKLTLTGTGGTLKITPIENGAEKPTKTVELPCKPTSMSVFGERIGFKYENVGGDPVVISDREIEHTVVG